MWVDGKGKVPNASCTNGPQTANLHSLTNVQILRNGWSFNLDDAMTRPSRSTGQNPRRGDGHFGVVIPICLSPDHLARSVDACLFQRDADIPARGGRQRRQLAEAPPGRAGTQGLQGIVCTI